MGKNLFGDLNTDISTKYKLWDYEATLDEIKQKIEDEIDILSKLKHDVVWARRVIDFYDEVMDAMAKDSKLVPLVENLSSLQEFKAEADKLLEDERKRQLEAAKKAQEEAEKQSIIEQAKNVDDKITMLLESERDSFWCDLVDDLVAMTDKLSSDVRKLCKKLNIVIDLKREKAMVLEAIKCDEEVRVYSSKEDWSRAYCSQVISFVNTVSDKVKKYMKNKWLLDDLLDRANLTIKRIDKKALDDEREEEERKERERKAREKKEKEEAEEAERQRLAAIAEAERKAKEEEEKRKKEEEEKRKKEEEKKRKAEEAKRKKEEEEKRKKEEEERKKREQEEKERALNALKQRFINCKENKTVEFGSYIQNKREKEPIEWIVIEKTRSYVRLLSKYVLETCDYGDLNSMATIVKKREGMSTTLANMRRIYNWENSYLRVFLNREFLYEAFDENERELLSMERNRTSYGEYSAPSFQETQEKVFILEDYSFFKKKFLKAKATKYALGKKVFSDKKGFAIWWLRHCNTYKPENNYMYPTVLNYHVDSKGRPCSHVSLEDTDYLWGEKIKQEINTHKCVGVRPSIVIKL